MKRIFISYSRQDEIFARRLAEALQNLGADVWIDVEDIQAGNKWSQAIQEGLDTATVMLVVISPDSMASENVSDEWQYFLDHKKPIIPILCRPAKIHFQLNRVQYIDFYNQDFDPALRRLHTELAVQGLVLRPLPPVPAPAKKPNPVPLHMPADQIKPVSESLQSQAQTPPQKRMGMGIAVGAFALFFLGLGVVILLSYNQGDNADNAERMLKAFSERNLGTASSFVCEEDQDLIRESDFWGAELENIVCSNSDSDEVSCTFTYQTESFRLTLPVRDDGCLDLVRQ
jgi:hypothetical protein